MKLKNIKQVFMSSASDAPAKVATDNAVVTLLNKTEIPIKPFAHLTISDKIDNGQRVFSAKLTLKTTNSILSDISRKVFYAVDLNGKCFVIGSNDRPYPLITQSDDHPENGSDEQLTVITVEYTSITPILYMDIA